MPLLVVGQNITKIDSLKKKLTPDHNEQRYKTLNDIGWEYRFAYPDSTITYTEKAYALGVELHLNKDLARSLNYQGVAYNYKGERLKAYDAYTQALKIATKQNDSVQIAYGNNNLGRLFFDQGLLGQAYGYYTKAFGIFKSINDQSGLAYTVQSIGTLQRSQKDFVQSEVNYLDAYRIRLQLKNQRDIVSAQMQLSRLYYEREEFEKSNQYLMKADSVCHYLNDKLIFSEIKLLIAKNLIGLDRIDEAEEPAEAAASVIEQFKFKLVLPEAMITLGRINLLKHRWSKADYYFQKALVISNETKNLQMQMHSYDYLWRLAEAINKKAEAVEYMNQYLVRKDSIKDLDVTRQVDRLQFQLEIEKKEKENELLKLSEANQASIIAEQRAQNIALYVALACLLSLSGGFWYYNRKRTQTNRKLEAQNQYIDLQRKQIEKRNVDLSTQNHKLADLNHEKDMLMNIVAHDLKSPLARVMGLTNLLSMENLSSTQKEYVSLMTDTVQSNLALIGDLLDVNMLQEQVQANHTSVFSINDLFHERIASFQQVCTSKQIDLKVIHSIDQDIVGHPNYIARILDNLISNAIKFSQKGSEVMVNASVDLGVLKLSVKDNGPGFTDADQRMLYQKFRKLSAQPTGGESSNGLGLAIVKTLVERLHGEITLESQLGKGSEFTIRIPVKVAAKASV